MINIKSFLISVAFSMLTINTQSQEVFQDFKKESHPDFNQLEQLDYSLANTQRLIIPQSSNLKLINTKYLPFILTLYGFSAIISNPLKEVNYEFKEEILEHHPTFRTHFDDYLQYSPAVTTFAFKLTGNSAKSDFVNSIRIFGISTLMMAGTVYALKKTTEELRPDGSNRSSFPSGHTATAFASAELLHQEFKNTSTLLSYSGYLAAAATGGLRMYNNKHYFSDVLAGAGIGILSTKAAYWLNKKLFISKH